MGAEAAQARAPFQQSLLPPNTYETSEEDLLWLAGFNPVSYTHPGIFKAAHGHVQIESHRIGDFLVRLAAAMGADQEGAAKDPYSRFKEYDALARAVYLGHCRAAEQQA